VSTEEEKVLSQADIDTLVGLMPDKPRTSSSSIKPITVDKPPQQQSIEPASTDKPAGESTSNKSISSSEVAGLQNNLADLFKRVNKLNEANQRLVVLEEKVEHLAKMMRLQSDHMQPLEQRITEISTRFREYSHFQKIRPELRDDFQCDECQSKANMAFLVKCTTCGKEEWFGWWPENNNSESP
jgi:hypothetical protein